MKKCLIVCHGYFGDHLFALSVAEKLINENQFSIVDYVIGFPQIAAFFHRNPYVNNVRITSLGPEPKKPENWQEYDACFQLGPINRIVPPAVEFQMMCGVKNPSPEFKITTNEIYDREAEAMFKEVRSKNNVPILSILNTWEERSFLFTEEEYWRGIDVHLLGYGGKHRNTKYITEKLGEHFSYVVVGAPSGVGQFDLNYNGPSLEYMASLLKYSDFFVGAEGGVANFAYAVNTRTILTSDFVWQLYGPNGVLQKLQHPMLGPVNYSSNKGYHIELNPFLTDEQVANEIIKTISESIK